jgi:hypothetical protein
MDDALSRVVAEWLRTGVPLVALVVSVLALWFTRKLWVQSNRPIVTAMVRTHAGGSESISYDLAVVNCGNRPAIAVRLTAQLDQVRQAMEPKALENPEFSGLLKAALRCFSEEAIIPLLLNGQTLTNAFGHTGAAGGEGPFWRVGATFPVSITYLDLEGRSFKSKVTVVIRDTDGFAGSIWSSEEK